MVERPARGLKKREAGVRKRESFSHFVFQTSPLKENAFKPRQIGE